MEYEKPKTHHRAPPIRPRTGRPKMGWVRTDEKIDYDEARARNEAAKADLNELELAVRRGIYVERAAVQQATATALATLAQTLRAVPDNLERRLGVSADVAQEVGVMIDNSLDDLATEFEQLNGNAGAAIAQLSGDSEAS